MIDGSGKFLKESKRAFPSPTTSLYKLFGLSHLFPHSKIFSKYHLGFLSENENHEVDVLAGAFMMLPKKIVDITGGFDEDFFMYGEDIDLSFRIQQAGFSNFYFAESTIIHFKGESTKKGSLNYVRMFYKAMSVFVKKHYGSAKAGTFSFLIHSAIFFRAGVAAITRFLKWIGLPVIDAGIILASFWTIKFLWSTFIKQQTNYSPNLLLIAFPAFTFLFLIASYFSGLYDNGFKQSRLNKSTVTAILVILSVYALLPESIRFSRGILFFGSLTAFLLMTLVRHLLVKWKVIESAAENKEFDQTLIAATSAEFSEISHFIEKANLRETISGRIETGDREEPGSIGNFKNLSKILKLYPAKEIIFCEGTLSFKKIIEVLPAIPPEVRVKIFAAGSRSIIGSNDKNAPGYFISKEDNYRLKHAIYRRSKNLFDVGVSLLFLVFSPVVLIFKKRPIGFLKKSIDVLLRKKTWIGYAAGDAGLPNLPPGIITTTGLPPNMNALAPASLVINDKLYARHYTVTHDIKLLWKNFQWL